MECFCTRPRTICCKILLLDGQEFFQEVQDSCNGQVILNAVFNHINLIETHYFGLRYLDAFGQTHWLEPTKKLRKQLKASDPYTLYFGVKFYAVDPCKLLEEITRYQFFLQCKQDILQGRLPVSTDLAAELGAYVLQSELGDFDPRVHLPGYVSEFKFVSNQSLELETRISELHKALMGQLPSAAEYNYLDRVKWLEMYGVDLHPVLGEDSVEYFLGLTPSGIIVLRNKITVGNYYWPRITKIYFKGRYFMLKVTDKNNDESTYGFETPSKLGCKHLWKCCVEHHSFFRLVQVYHPTVPDIFALGSRFSGRTEEQGIKSSQVKGRVPPTFSRKPSRRFSEKKLDDFADLEVDEVLHIPDCGSLKHISIPQPVQGYDQTYSHQMKDDNRRTDSPRSTRSAPWSQPHSKGLYNISAPASPRSIRSAGPRYRSSSVDSQSSGDSKTYKRKKHSGRGTSDNESELSKSSCRSHHRHKKHRSRSRKGSRGDGDGSSSRRNSRSRRRESSQPELVDSNYQWKEAKKRISVDGNANNIQQAHIISGSRLIDEKDSKKTPNPKYKHRHPQSRHHSPGESKHFLSDEVKKHLEFDLIDTTGMSEKQLKEIPYTVVETNNNFKQSKGKVNQARMLDTMTMLEYADNMVHHRKNKPKNMCLYDSSGNLTDNFAIKKDLSENILKSSHDHSDSGLVTDQETHNNERLLSRKFEMMSSRP
ncbi:band 4.1-like protein 4 isoform X2 [Coccinella septempunctata]|uniref:band 4.1-like protein 4 isoform X2 n=1 Tax=Coccinella septempunctata TaxID=41139 RepID=UPI001D0918AA|nr:band 4.1-like protein 4 isoform X2 [Coccinella septempunctata]